MTKAIIAVFLLVCCVQICIRSSLAETNGVKCDLKAWYMDALAEGLLDDDTDSDDAKSDVKVEVLQLVRRKKGLIYVDCAQIENYDRILRTKSAPSVPDTHNDSTDIDTEYDSVPHSKSKDYFDEDKTTSKDPKISGIDQTTEEKSSDDDDEIGQSGQNADESRRPLDDTATGSLQDVMGEGEDIKEDKNRDAIGDSEEIKEDMGSHAAGDGKETKEDTGIDVTGNGEEIKEDTGENVSGDRVQIKANAGIEITKDANTDVADDIEKPEEDTGKYVAGDEEIKGDTGMDITGNSKEMKADTGEDATGDSEEITDYTGKEIIKEASKNVVDDSEKTKEDMGKVDVGDGEEIRGDTGTDVTGDNEEIKEDTGKDVAGDSEEVKEDTRKNVTGNSDEIKEDISKNFTFTGNSEEIIREANKDGVDDSEKTADDTGKDDVGDVVEIRGDTGIDVTGDSEKLKEDIDVSGTSEEIKEDANKDVVSDSEQIVEDTGIDASVSPFHLDGTKTAAEPNVTDALPNSEPSHRLQDAEEDRNTTSSVRSTESKSESEGDVAGHKHPRRFNVYAESLQFVKESKSGYCILTRAKECWYTPRRFHNNGDLTTQSLEKDETTGDDSAKNNESLSDVNKSSPEAVDSISKTVSETVDSNIRSTLEGTDFEKVTTPETLGSISEKSVEAEDSINKTKLESTDSTNVAALKNVDSTNKTTLAAVNSISERSPEVPDSRSETSSETTDSINETIPETIDSKSEAELEAEDSTSKATQKAVVSTSEPIPEGQISVSKTTPVDVISPFEGVGLRRVERTLETMEGKAETPLQEIVDVSGKMSEVHADSSPASEQSSAAHPSGQSVDSGHVMFKAESKNEPDNKLLKEWFLSAEQRYSDKIQSLELQISRMENHMLQESIDVQSKNSAIDQLEKHILRLESEILRFNHTFRDLQSEHKRLLQSQKMQIQQIGNSKELGEPGSGNKDDASSCMMAVKEHQNKITHLSEMVQKQSSLIEKLQEKFQQVEGDNHLLVKQILNQSILMNEVLSKMNAMNEEQEWHKGKLKTIQESCERTSRWVPPAKYEGDSQTQREDELEILMGRTRFNSAERANNYREDADRPMTPKILDKLKVGDGNLPPDGNDFELKAAEPTLPPSVSGDDETNSSRTTNSMNIGHPEVTQIGEDSTDPKYKATENGHINTDDQEDYEITDAFAERSTDDYKLGNEEDIKLVENNDVQRKEDISDDIEAQTKEDEIEFAFDDSKESNFNEEKFRNREDTKPVDNNDVQLEIANSDDEIKDILDDSKESNFDNVVKVHENLPTNEEATHAEATPAYVTPVEATQADATQADATQADATPVEATKGEATPAEATPAEATPAEATPAEATPTEANVIKASDESKKSEEPVSDKSDKQIPEIKTPIGRLLKQSGKQASSHPKSSAEESSIKKSSENSESRTTENGDPKQTKPNKIINSSADKTTPSSNSPPIASEQKDSAKVLSKENTKPSSSSPKSQKSIVDAFPDPPIYKMKNRDNMKDCYDHYMKGRRHNTPLKVNPGKGNKAIEVYCDMKNGGWTLIQKRQDGAVDFYRSWNDYKNGFGSIYGEHWIGNENIHLLTNQDHYSLRVELTDWDRNTQVIDYDRFRISDESDGYRIFVTGYQDSPAGDSLTKHHGSRFSTMDVDNDLVEKEFGGSCARRFSGAWWYYKCYKSNLNGKYYRGGSVEAERYDGVAWKSWTGSKYSLKKVEMKVIPRSAPKS